MSQAPRLNILQVASCFADWGGTELHLLRLSDELARRGHSVTIACQPGRFVEQRARDLGIRTVAATTKRQQDWSAAETYSQILRRERYDVVHVHWSGDYVVPPTVARLRKVPAVLMSRHHPDPFRSASSRLLYGKVLFDRIIAVSESVRQTLIAQGISPDKVVTIHNSVDPTALRRITVSPDVLRAEWGVPSDAVLVGMVGRVAWEKGVLDFLTALSRLPEQPKVSAVIVGTGPQLEEATAKARELGLDSNGRLRFVGFRDDPNNCIGALDVHVLASVWKEPCATVVMEAMALGKPVIGTAIGGTPEMVADGVTGLLVPPENPEALADAISRVSTNGELRAKMGSAGRERVENLFTLAHMTDGIEAIYNTLAGTADS
jgi:glycosyltransferase involved in cell wall biosynthesis